jgi:OmpA-OmpF porin, OOP family
MSRQNTYSIAWLLFVLSFLGSSGCNYISNDRTNAIIAGSSLGALAGGAMGCGAAAAWGYTSDHTESARDKAFEIGCPVGVGLGAIVGGVIAATTYHPAPPQLVAQAPPPPPPPPPPPTPPPAPQKIILRGVHFDFDKAVIRSMDRPVLDEAAETLKANPNVKVEVNGYCDAIGGTAYNLKLSQRRAEAVAAYLEDQGIPASQLTPQGFGKTHFVATNSTAEGRAENRRVELVPEQQ